MRTSAALFIFGALAAPLPSCARCNADKPAAIDAALLLDRWTQEPPSTRAKTGKKLVYYDIEVDERGLLLPQGRQPFAFADVVDRGFSWLTAIPNSENGKKVYYFSSMFTVKPDGVAPEGWAHNPTGLSAMLVRSALRYRDYSGDGRALADARRFVDYVLANGRTEVSDAWSLVPYASADAGDVRYRGAHDERYCPEKLPCGRGDGPGFLEPDKVGEFGHALVLIYEATSDASYLEAALKCADALAKHVGEGDAEHSPWPFRVDAKTGTVVRDAYSSNVILTIQLLDELKGLGRASHAHGRARDMASAWLEKFPMKNMRWQGFFEDIPNQRGPSDNANQYSPGETARYYLRRGEPGDLARAKALVTFIKDTFVVDAKLEPGGMSPAIVHGAETVSEQRADMAKMGSHTARYASLLAAIYERTGEASLRDRARRSFAWATYCIDPRGVVKVGPDDVEGFWFSDGYGDYMIHFLDGMAAVPAWVPTDKPHVLRTTTVLRRVTVQETRLSYDPFGPGTDEVVVPGRDARVTVEGQEVRPRERRALSGGAGGEWLRIERKSPGEVTIQWAR